MLNAEITYDSPTKSGGKNPKIEFEHPNVLRCVVRAGETGRPKIPISDVNVQEISRKTSNFKIKQQSRKYLQAHNGPDMLVNAVLKAASSHKQATGHQQYLNYAMAGAKTQDGKMASQTKMSIRRRKLTQQNPLVGSGRSSAILKHGDVWKYGSAQKSSEARGAPGGRLRGGARGW